MALQNTALDDFLKKSIAEGTSKGNATRLKTILLSLSVR